MRRAPTLAIAVAVAAASLGGCTCRKASAPAAAGTPRHEASSAATTNAAVAQLSASMQCGTTSREPYVRWFGTAEEYREAITAKDKLTMSGTAPAEDPPIDFGERGVLEVAMGQRPTAGYGLELASDEVRPENGIGVVRVNWTEPKEDAAVAQVVTSPCIRLAVRKEGLREVEVVDQAGRVRGTVAVR
jgi:hypothetical protein